jgi:glycosyltransferase involved in cell wall biosynthesis
MQLLRKNVVGVFTRVCNKFSEGAGRAESQQNEKLVVMPTSFLSVFNEESYLAVNPDVKQSIKKGRFQSALDHLKGPGYREVQEGGRRIGALFPHFNVDVYLKYNPDLALLSATKAFEHFIEHGYSEYLQGKRIVIGYYPQPVDLVNNKKIKSKFDEEAYLNANADVVEAIEDGIVKSGWDHFVNYGLHEAMCFGRTLNVMVGSMTEPEYLFKFPDLFEPLMKGVISSPYEHFLLHGLAEIVSGKRNVHPHGGYFYHEPKLTESIKREILGFPIKPLISIVIPVYNVEKKWLQLAISSVQCQWYGNWEICIADDASTNKETVEYLKSIQNNRIKVKLLTTNVNISGASNEALSLATGDYVALMDHDDEITPDALYEVVMKINEGAEFIYSDEDKVELDGQFTDPHFKPDFSPDMFFSHNYISHLSVIKRSLMQVVGGWSLGVEGAQDYDLYLKVLEHTNKICHISKVLYHWRKVPGSTAVAFNDKSYAQQAGKKALSNALERRGIDGQVTYGVSAGLYRINYVIEGAPLVSIIIPFKDKPELLSACVSSILEKTTYDNFEIIGLSNNSVENETINEMDRLETLDSRVRFFEYNVPFNYSKINNYGANELAKGKYIVFMNNDIEVISECWLEEMLMLAQRKETGCVGAKLLYENSTIQHAGVVLAPGTTHLVVPVFSGFPRGALGYSARIATVNNYSAVTAALMMIDKAKFKAAGGFDEINLAVAYNDIDLCLKVKSKGYHNVYTPYAEAFHYESLSRGADTESLSKLERMTTESESLKRLNPDYFSIDDQSYNPNLSLYSVDFSIAPSVGRLNEPYVGREFSENILEQTKISQQKNTRLCLFSHYDQGDIIDDYVVFYIKELSRLYDVVFISTAEGLSSAEISKVDKYCIGVLVKENHGYDFGAWKSGLNYIAEVMQRYDYLLMCNDSVYGPFHDLESVVSTMEKAEFDVWSMSDNYEYHYHLQSYFVQYSKSAFNHSLFVDNWSNFKIFTDKQTLINKYEIGYLNALTKCSALKVGAYCSMTNKSYLNPLHYYWRDMISDGVPFLKVELLKKNPVNVDISDYESIIQNSCSSYSLPLIKSHLSRVG